jgi:hypothetical protein
MSSTIGALDDHDFSHSFFFWFASIQIITKKSLPDRVIRMNAPSGGEELLRELSARLREE